MVSQARLGIVHLQSVYFALAVIGLCLSAAPAKAQFGLHCPGTWINYGGGKACQCADGSLANYVNGQVICGGGGQNYSQQNSGGYQPNGDPVTDVVNGIFNGLSKLLPSLDQQQTDSNSDDSYVDKTSKESERRLREKVDPNKVWSARQGFVGAGKYRHCDGNVRYHATFDDHFSALKSVTCGGGQFVQPQPTAPAQNVSRQPTPNPSVTYDQSYDEGDTQDFPQPYNAGAATGGNPLTEIFSGLTKMLPTLNQQPAANSGGSYVDQMTTQSQQRLQQKVGPNKIWSARQGFVGPGNYRHCDGSTWYHPTSEKHFVKLKQIGC